MPEHKRLDLPPLDPMMSLTLNAFIDTVAGRFGEREAVVLRDALNDGRRTSWTYDQLRMESRRIAKALIADGIGKGARVGILLGNRPEFVAALFGIAMAGATAVTLSTFSTRDEMAQLVRLSDIGTLLTQRQIARRSLADDLASLIPALLDPSYPFLRQVVVLGGLDDGPFNRWETWLASGNAITDALLDSRTARVGANDEAVIIFTSGTTALPKGVIHLHSTFIKQFQWESAVYGRHPGTRIASPFPLFWSAGIVSVLGSTLAAGGTYVADEVFEPGAALRLVADERIDEYYGFPTHTAALADHPDWPTADLSSLTRVRGNNEFDGHPNTNPDPNWNHIVAYGMSESCTSVVSHLSSTPTEIQQKSAGLPLPGIALRIIDFKTGAVLETGNEGEILVRGPTLMPHYIGMSREETFDEDGWFHTGDTGFIDPEGFLHWTGRLKNMVKTGGANVAPSEVEAAAAALGVLKLCRAIGLPDPRLGEMLVLCAVKEEGSPADEASVRAALRQTLAAYKVPRRVLFFSIEDYPLTASGKVIDGELKARVSELLLSDQTA